MRVAAPDCFCAVVALNARSAGALFPSSQSIVMACHPFPPSAPRDETIALWIDRNHPVKGEFRRMSGAPLKTASNEFRVPEDCFGSFEADSAS